jgi:hypothetical protein
MAPEFLDAVREFVARATEDRPLSGKGITGQKDQFLFDFPAAVNYERELFDVLAPLTGLSRSTMTLSERHIKAYSADADPRPAAHKDRFPSQISVGLSIDVPLGSYLVLYPYDHREVNPFLSTGLRDSLEPDQLPEVILRDAREVEIHDAPGDVIVFPGSSLWHLRRNSAGTVNLYLKFNDFDSDPLGEDPSTTERRIATLAALKSDPQILAETVPVVSRRFDSIAREHSRDGWRASLVANVWGQPAVGVSEAEFAVLRALGERTTFSSLVASGVDGLDCAVVDRAIRRLAARGAIDFIS